MEIQAKLLSFLRVFVIPFGVFFALWLSVLFALIFMYNPQATLTKDVVNLFILASVIFAMPFAGAYALLTTTVYLFQRASSPFKTLSKRISKSTAYDLKYVSTSATIIMMILTFLFIIIAFRTSEILYFLTFFALLLISVVLLSLSEGVMDERNAASFLLQRFSEKIEKSVKNKNPYLLSSRDFKKAFKTFDNTLPRAVYTASLEKRTTQIELLLCFGNKSDLSTLSKHIQSVAQSLERNYLEGFDKEYLNFANYLDKFVEGKKGVVDFVEKVPLRDRIAKETGAILKEILVKTVPILIGILISVLVYLWLGYPVKLPSGT